MKVAQVYASEVQVGDLLVLPDLISEVIQVDTFDLGAGSWPCLRLLTKEKGVARFPHETVEVGRL